MKYSNEMKRVREKNDFLPRETFFAITFITSITSLKVIDTQ